MAKQQSAWRVALNYYVGGSISAKIVLFLIFDLFLKNTLTVLNETLPFYVGLISGLCFVILAAYFGAWYINSRYIFIKTTCFAGLFIIILVSMLFCGMLIMDFC